MCLSIWSMSFESRYAYSDWMYIYIYFDGMCLSIWYISFIYMHVDKHVLTYIHAYFDRMCLSFRQISFESGYACSHTFVLRHAISRHLYSDHLCYWMATISRLLKIIVLFCTRALYKRRYSAKETCNFKEPTNRYHPIRHAILRHSYSDQMKSIKC